MMELVTQLPPLKSDARGQTYLVTPLSGGVRASTLSLLFTASYALGMLARYYPTQWLGLLGRQKGDFTLPLLKATIRLIQTRFPSLILRELTSP
jgi:hypothetical protein